MSRLTPYRGTLLQLALANALLVGVVAATFLFVNRATGPGGRLGSSAVVEFDPGPAAIYRAAEFSAEDQALLVRLSELIAQEIEIAEVAMERAGHLALRRLAHQLVAQHRQVRKEIAAMAGDRGLELPGADRNRGAGAALAATPGEQFDAAFLKQTAINQAAALKECEQAAAAARDPQLRSFAERLIPVLQGYHEQARRLQRAMF
jgi:predicted outer membrane protein